jgi:flagellar basal-body rod protein FlgB
MAVRVLVFRGGTVEVSSVADVTMRAVERAMNGLEVRRTQRAHNLANVNTPGFKAKTVDFETSLKSALETGRPETAGLSTRAGIGPANEFGNTVQLDSELIGLTRDDLLQQAMVNAYNYKVGLFRSVTRR